MKKAPLRELKGLMKEHLERLAENNRLWIFGDKSTNLMITQLNQVLHSEKEPMIPASQQAHTIKDMQDAVAQMAQAQSLMQKANLGSLKKDLDREVAVSDPSEIFERSAKQLVDIYQELQN